MICENHLQHAAQFRAAEGENGERTIEGYFAVFGDVYDMGGGWTESIDPHAFDGTLNGDVRALINHDSTLVIGRNTAGTLELHTDGHGLYGRVKINPEDTEAVNAWARVRRGDVDQASFGFETLEEEREQREDGKVHWTLKRVKLWEVSVCTFPAYESTSLSARHGERSEAEKRKSKIWINNTKERIKKWH